MSTRTTTSLDEHTPSLQNLSQEQKFPTQLPDWTGRSRLTAMAPPPDHPTPLAPSVEKAYYRKCIQLKRRLNEVELANDEYKIRRVRLDRAIMKMRLERAFLLEQLAKRMEYNVDGSDGSNDEAVATPPPDRPHRDKRRRVQPSTPAQQAVQSAQPAPPSSQPFDHSDRKASEHHHAGSPPLATSNGGAQDGRNPSATSPQQSHSILRESSPFENSRTSALGPSRMSMEGIEHHARESTNGDSRGPSSRADDHRSDHRESSGFGR